MSYGLAALLALAAGAAVWWIGRRRTRAMRAELSRLARRQRRVGEIEEAGRREGASERTTPADRLRSLEAALDSARSQLGASRVVLWDVEPEAHRIMPRYALPGGPARPVSLAGTPLRWVWEEQLPLRLEARPGGAGWMSASGGACAVPVEQNAILVFEFEHGALPPDVTSSADAGRQVAALLDLHRAQIGAEAARVRFDQLLRVLERLTRANAVEEWAGELAETASMLIDGTGAAVASWSAEGGRVLALRGNDGGPSAGLAIDDASELAAAARGGAPIIRAEIDSRPPLAAPGERWYARPRSLVILPLQTADGVLGLVAAWNADETGFDEAGLAALRTLAPYGALQLRQMVMQDTLRERAERDVLTGLPNRLAFTEKLDDAVRLYRRYHHPVGLILLDVDHFKRVNDTWGHAAGDAVLRQVGRIIASSIRDTDHAARIGGEEFAVLLAETDLAHAVETADRIRAAVERAAVDYEGEALTVRISAGVSACPGVVRDPAGLLTSADGALYASKQAGRNRVTAASTASSMSPPK